DHELRGTSLMELGDWYLCADQADRSLARYREAWKEFQQAGSTAPLDAPRQLAYRTPASSAARSPLAERDSTDEHSVQATFTVKHDGHTANVTTSSSDATAAQQKTVLAAVRRARYAPRLLNGERLVVRQLLREGLLRKLHQEFRRRITHGRERGALERLAAREALGERAAITGEGQGVDLLPLWCVDIDAVADRGGVVASAGVAVDHEGILVDQRLEHRPEPGGGARRLQILEFPHLAERVLEDVAQQVHVPRPQRNVPLDTPACLLVHVIAQLLRKDEPDGTGQGLQQRPGQD